MKPTLILSALLSCFVISGNAQEPAPVSGPVNYSTQGNASQNRSVYELELQRAAQEARRMKELKASIAASAFGPPPPITSADQFLATNRPPTPPPSEEPEGEGSAAEVPEFENASVPSRPVEASGNIPTFEMPEKERSFFKWMKGKKNDDSAIELPPAGSSQYETGNPYEAPDVSSTPPEPPAPPENQGIPDVPAMNEEPAPIMRSSTPPAVETPSEPAPIFVRREEPVAASGETAVVEKDADAIVSGVLVKLFAGTQVSILERNGSDVTVRLPDGRVGMLKKKSLSR
ncbi:MAG: hypothetical protein P1U58_12680 [Verrucomicrobiales bacterium]|nr:hypothetical protein [Verrucomicrobiales bacterium]